MKTMKKTLLMILIAATLFGCTPRIPEENGSINVYFTHQDSVLQELENIINASNESVDAALYQLSVDTLINLLKEKNADVVVDEDSYFGYGTEIKSYGIMHNKFGIIDQKYVFSGSLNPTKKGIWEDNNNLVIIESKYLAKNYEDEFNEIKANPDYEKNKKDKSKKTKTTQIMLNGHLIENYFCPEDACAAQLLEELKQAKKSIYFMTFSFTYDDIGDYMVSRRDSLDVKGIFEKRMDSEYSEYWKMLKAGMQVREDTNPADLHHKVFIIDNETVVTGSFNPSQNADTRNDENMLIIHDPEIAAKFVEEFNRIWR